ncbi:MAG TPA: sigma-70 family RNA polymerase sigma factor [Syntrophales bacterium]|nr:sigma-70 family RNA polymerase sigma factor [Syntrophobacterales bacterium]HQL89017.1 sigma-70 family RNA polymerase sigma factor [Syntrophales bacterium]
MTAPVIAALNRMTDDEDADAVLRCRRGDADAFEALVERHQKRMLNVAYRMLGDCDEACDVVQEAFLAAWRAIRSFRGEAKFSTWLYGIAVNRARNRIRQSQGRSRRETASIDDPDGPDQAGASRDPSGENEVPGAGPGDCPGRTPTGRAPDGPHGIPIPIVIVPAGSSPGIRVRRRLRTSPAGLKSSFMERFRRTEPRSPAGSFPVSFLVWNLHDAIKEFFALFLPHRESRRLGSSQLLSITRR